MDYSLFGFSTKDVSIFLGDECDFTNIFFNKQIVSFQQQLLPLSFSTPINIDTRSSRPKRSPLETSMAEDAMVLARRASDDALYKLQNKNLISRRKKNVSDRYPSEICGIGKCSLRSLFNVLGQRAFQQKISSNDWLLHGDAPSSKIDAYIYSL